MSQPTSTDKSPHSVASPEPSAPPQGGAAFLCITACLYLLAAWLWSGMSRDGLWIFLGALAVLILAILAFRRGRRRVLHGVYLAAVLASTAILGIELVLHLAPGVVRGDLANATFSGYDTGPDGIYRPDPILGRALRASYRRKMFWEGHWWQHETCSDGYRGERLERAGAVFLGDSMIYGHGVEVEQTVAAAFQGLSGLKSANLGQQGTCPIQHLVLLERLGLRLGPQYVFLCCHYNDIVETGAFYERDELEKFIARGPDGVASLRAKLKYSREPTGPASFWHHHVAPRLRTRGAWSGLRRLLRTRGIGQAFRFGFGGASGSGSGAEVFTPDESTLNLPLGAASVIQDPETSRPESVALLWRANTHAMLRVKEACARIGATLVIFDLGYPHAFSQAVEAFAVEHGIVFSPIGRTVLQRVFKGEAMYLARDGHWSPAGSRAVAEELWKLVQARGGGAGGDR